MAVADAAEGTSRQDGGAFRIFPRRPARPLDRVVADYEGYVEESIAPTQRREPASVGTVLIFPFGPELQVAASADRELFRSYESGFVAGAGDSYAVTRSQGTSAGIQVNLSPIVARMLWGVPMADLANGIVSLEEILGRDGRDVAERLKCAGSWAERFELLDAFLAGRLAGAGLPPKGLLWAWQRLVDSGGVVGVGDLAQCLGWTHRRLIAEFRDHIGFPPKTVARIIRFGRVSDRLRAAGPWRWSEIALDCGYYDQAHLVRDVVQFTGSTPREYLQRFLAASGGCPNSANSYKTGAGGSSENRQAGPSGGTPNT
jgi:AraC-like DNA-binding protein